MTEPARRHLVSVRLFELTPHLLSVLRERRDLGDRDEIMEAHDAFLLDPGLGPAVYLSSDGRILWDDDGWGVVGTRADALAAILVGAKKTGILDLHRLLPARPATAVDCAECSASGWFVEHGQLKDSYDRVFSIVCATCAGLGWTALSTALTQSVLEAG